MSQQPKSNFIFLLKKEIALIDLILKCQILKQADMKETQFASFTRCNYHYHYSQTWSVNFMSKSDSWVNYALKVAFLGSNTEALLCFMCNKNKETVNHHFIDYPTCRDNYSSLWSVLKTKISIAIKMMVL